MTKPFSEKGNVGAKPVSDEGRSHSFSRQSHGVKAWLFFQESDLEVKIIDLAFMDLTWPIWGKHYSVYIEAH